MRNQSGLTSLLFSSGQTAVKLSGAEAADRAQSAAPDKPVGYWNLLVAFANLKRVIQWPDLLDHFVEIVTLRLSLGSWQLRRCGKLIGVEQCGAAADPSWPTWSMNTLSRSTWVSLWSTKDVQGTGECWSSFNPFSARPFAPTGSENQMPHYPPLEMRCWSGGRGMLTELSLCCSIIKWYTMVRAVLTGRSTVSGFDLAWFRAPLYLRCSRCCIYLFFLFYVLMSWARWDWPLTWLT